MHVDEGGQVVQVLVVLVGVGMITLVVGTLGVVGCGVTMLVMTSVDVLVMVLTCSGQGREEMETDGVVMVFTTVTGDSVLTVVT